MTECTVDRKEFLKFIPLFGKDTEDIVLRVKDDEIEATVSQLTHYLKACMAAEGCVPGKVAINDLPRLIAFLKANKDDNVTIVQGGLGKILHVAVGISTLQMPSSTYIKSQKETSIIEQLIERCQNNMWTKWERFPLEYSGRINSADFVVASHMSKVVGERANCKTDFSVNDNEFVMRAGKGVKAKMFVRVPIIDAKGPSTTATSAYGHWLPDLLQCLPSGEVDIHTGEDTVLILKQEDNFLLLVLDMDYEED